MGQLRNAMLQDMELRQFADNTQRAYLRACRAFAAHFMRSPDEMGTDEVKRFLLDLGRIGFSAATLSQYRAALGFLYRVTLKRPDVIAAVPRPKQHAEETSRLARVPGRQLVRGHAVDEAPGDLRRDLWSGPQDLRDLRPPDR